MGRLQSGGFMPAAGAILAVVAAMVAITTRSDAPPVNVQQAVGSSERQRRILCSSVTDGVQAGVEVDFAVPLLIEEVSKYSPHIAVVTARGKGPSECAGTPPSIYTEQQLQVESVIVNKPGSPETPRYLLMGGSVGKNTLRVEGGYPPELAIGQRYVLYVHPLDGNPRTLLIDVAMPIDEQGRVVERTGTDEERRVPLEDVRGIIRAAAQATWPIEP